MKFLIIGDIVGKPGLNRLRDDLKKLIEEENIDFCIVNGENAANGKGIRKLEYDEIISYGADVITMGNHIYYRREMASEYIKYKRLVLPANITNINANKFVIVERNNKKIAVINLIGKAEMADMIESNSTNPFKEADIQINEVKNLGADYIFIDFHAEATAEKIALGQYLSEKVTCVFGTHTHVQTADERIFNTGMAYITDIGMTGPKDSVLGLKKEVALTRFVIGEFAKYECSNNEAMLNGIIVTTNDETNKSEAIKRINI